MNSFAMDYETRCCLSGLSFDFLNKSAVHKLSVKKIRNPFALDRLLNPVPHGLYDLALGPLDKNDVCLTCHLDYFKCPGHFGHIDLALPVYNPIFFKDLVKLLRVSCFSCHTLTALPVEKDYFYARMRLLDHGLLDQMQQIDELYARIVHSAGGETRLIDQFSKSLHRTEFRELLERLIAEADEDNSSNRLENRNVTKAKIEILKKMFGMNPKLQCPNCNKHIGQIRAELNSKIFSKIVSTRHAKRQQHKKKKKKEEIIVQNDDDDEITRIPDDLEKDLNGEVIEEDEENIDENDESAAAGTQSYLTPVEVRKHMRMLCENERDVLVYLLGKSVEDESVTDLSEMFFFDCVAVPPSRFRPISQFREQKFENAQTTQLSRLVQINVMLKEALQEIVSSGGDQDDTNADDPIDTSLLEKIIQSNTN